MLHGGGKVSWSTREGDETFNLWDMITTLMEL